ncbi:MAG: ATP-binding protein [Gemmataceae bacterium]|nr:ATP-binding protein [Gemmataceae bacterium]
MPPMVCPVEMPVARLTVPAELVYLPAVLNLVRDLAAQHGMDPREVERLAFVAEEAAANIIANAYPPGETGPLDLLLIRRPGKLVVALEDQGLPFDFRAFEKVENTFLIEILHRAFAGEVCCRSLHRQGNRVELIHDLPARASLAHVADEEIARTAVAPPAPTDAELTIRLMQPEDVEGLVRCTYRTFGYSYFDETFYDPEQVQHLLASGQFQVIVAVNPAGEVVGHLSLTLERPDAIVAEATLAVVDPRYRGHHLFERMKSYAKDYARERGWLGLYSEAVAIHPYSQKGCLAIGARETGVLLADMPSDVAFKHIQDTNERQATVLFYVLTLTPPPRDVWAPSRHEAILRRLYEHNALPRTVRPIAAADPKLEATGLPQLDVKVDVGAGEAYLTVRAAGPGLDRLASIRLNELLRRRLDVIYFDLPLGHSGAIRHTVALEKLGFFFGGIIPEMIDGDVLRLQYLNKATMDPARLQLASDFGRELLAYVVKCQGEAGERGA